MSVVLALLSSVLWGAADFLGGTVSRRRVAAFVVGTSQLVGLLAMAAVAVATGALDEPTGYLPWAVLAGLGGVVGLVCFYAALAVGTMGVVSPIAALGVVVPVVVGLGRGERPGVLALVGIAVAITGVVAASGPELSGRAGARPLLLAAVAAVGFGVALLFIAEGARTSTIMTLVTMRALTVSILTVALVVALRRLTPPARAGLRLDRRDVLLVAVIGLGDAFANLAYGEASRSDYLSVVAVLGSLYPVVTVLLARGLHGERLERVQTVGVVGALAGVAMIASAG